MRAIHGRLKWYQAPEILGISDRQMRRWKVRYERRGYDGLFDRRLRRHRLGDAGIGLGVVVGDGDLPAEDAADHVDLLDGEVDRILPVDADGRARAQQLDDIGDLDDGGRLSGRESCREGED